VTAPSPKAGCLAWPPLAKGVLVRRYKRFLADVILEDGRAVTAHCPNSGSMTGCSEPGRPVYLSLHQSASRKLPYTLELIDMGVSLVGVNTLVPNRLVKKAATDGVVKILSGYFAARSEVKVFDHSRIDLLLTAPGRRDCFVEVKNCTLVEKGLALFPDAVTLRGKKHLEDLTALAGLGHRALLFLLVQRMDASAFAPADSIDPNWGRALRAAANAGVEIAAFDTAISTEFICMGKSLPVHL
jgi:sugar fermentation stimulation protein A